MIADTVHLKNVCLYLLVLLLIVLITYRPHAKGVYIQLQAEVTTAAAHDKDN